MSDTPQDRIAIPHCLMCNDYGWIGGHAQDGSHDDQPCPDCNNQRGVKPCLECDGTGRNVYSDDPPLSYPCACTMEEDPMDHPKVTGDQKGGEAQ